MVVGAGLTLRAQDTARAAIEAGNKRFVAAFAKKDAAGVAAAYSPDANAFPPNAPIVKGRAGIQKMWQDVSTVFRFTVRRAPRMPPCAANRRIQFET